MPCKAGIVLGFYYFVNKLALQSLLKQNPGDTARCHHALPCYVIQSDGFSPLSAHAWEALEAGTGTASASLRAPRQTQALPLSKRSEASKPLLSEKEKTSTLRQWRSLTYFLSFLL